MYNRSPCTYIHIYVCYSYRVAASGLRLYTSGSVFIGHEGVAQVVYQNGSHKCITRKPRATPSLYDDITDKS